ncbi:MAG TPA: glycosyltransferase [Bacteroidia bacterium]|jgi:glycosyltransferase involved in cell wall biosynthesis|nr:glycosyltransferase [Bacteroidia bacterium]
MDTPFKVSVRLITYNHEQFIAQAIEGVLAQKTDFPVELIIADDFSTDNTLKIAQQYSGIPNITVTILNRQKGDTYWVKRQQLGRLYNNTDSYSKCTGKYIALLDGDDFWIDPRKLQKQVDFLEAHPDFAICFHDINKCWVNDAGETWITDAPNIKREVSTFENLCEEGSFIQTSSVVIRNGLIKQFPDWYYKAPYGDWPLYLLLAEHGKIEKLGEIMSSHREHSGGIYKNQFKGGSFGIHALQLIKTLDTHFKHKYHKYFYAHNRILTLTNMALNYSRNTKSFSQTLYYTYKMMVLKSKDTKLNGENIKKLFRLIFRTIGLKKRVAD